MLINPHRLFSFGKGFKLKFPLLNSWLNLLSEDLAIISVMRRRIMPVAILHPFKLFCRWYSMELRELNLPLLKQQIKYLIVLSDIKAESFWLLLPKGQDTVFLPLTHSASPIILSSSSESEHST
jgi:hypothetical protein